MPHAEAGSLETDIGMLDHAEQQTRMHVNNARVCSPRSGIVDSSSNGKAATALEPILLTVWTFYATASLLSFSC
jgi:hypothetical protein